MEWVQFEFNRLNPIAVSTYQTVENCAVCGDNLAPEVRHEPMLKTPTTFVIGAGASCDFGFPTGDGLQAALVKALALTSDNFEFRNEQINRSIEQKSNSTNWSEQKSRYANAAKQIIKGMPTAASIDNFIHTHRENRYIVDLAKLAIAYCISDAEERSPLYRKNSLIHQTYPLSRDEFRNSWYAPFIKILTSGTNIEEPLSFVQNVRFVVFNYDRVLELILLLTLESYYALDRDSALEYLSKIEIVHPYGSLGTFGHGGQLIPFGSKQHDLWSVASSIRTFTESVDDDVARLAKHFVSEARRLVFLGFGFLEQNILLLTPDGPKNVNQIHASTYGISNSDKVVLEPRLQNCFMVNNIEIGKIEFVQGQSKNVGFIDVNNELCTDLIFNHRFRLSA